MASKEENEWEANRKIFIGGLKVETVEEDLHTVFSEFGAIYDHVVIRDPESRRSRGFGFVTYEKPESVQMTLDARPIHVNGKEVDVKRAVPRSQSMNTPQEAKTQKLFIGGLLASTKEDHIREAFSAYGKV
jgi:heterogeneous nuclear ribonucleoprotein A1/A3